MFATFHQLIQNTMTDAAITTHLLHHRSRPTVAHILAGLNQLRYRGRTGGVRQLLAQAQAWSAPLNLAPADPLVVAAALAPVLVAPLEALVLPNSTRRMRPTQQTLQRLTQASIDFPVAPAHLFVAETGLHRDTVRAALSNLSEARLLRIEGIRGEQFVITTAYFEFFSSLVAANQAEVTAAQVHTRLSSLRQVSNQDSPFDRFYDPFFYRSNPPRDS